MARTLRPLLVALAAVAFALPATASAASSIYDPDGFAFTTRPSADLNLTQSGTYVFDPDSGDITAPDNTVIRSGNLITTTPNVQDDIGVVGVTNPTFGPFGTEFVVNSLTLGANSTITTLGDRNLIIATYHDLDIEGTVDLNGLGGAAGFGPGMGDHPVDGSPCSAGGGGGSFGGFGGASGDGTASGGTYGAPDLSGELLQGSGGGDSASGCGTADGGSAGGGVGLVAVGQLTINGNVTANGEAPTGVSNQGGPGGGSGGGILVMSPNLSLASQSVFSATGGAGGAGTDPGYNGGGGGGGGRISLLSDLPAGSVNFVATAAGLGGASGGDPGLAGEAGTGGSIGELPFLTVSGPTTKHAAQSATFSASQAVGDATFAWDFGDGASGAGQAPSHTYSAPGTYHVTVTATLTDSGETATAQRSITVTPAVTPPSGGGAGTTTTTPTTPTTPSPPAPAVQHCVVPKLKGLSLSAARKKLARAHCKLGKVKRPKPRKGTKKKPKLVIVKQPAANRTLPAGTKVNLTLATAKPKRYH